MKPLNQIQEVVDNLKNRGENEEWSSSYLQKIIERMEIPSPKLVNNYLKADGLSVTLHNQKTK